MSGISSTPATRGGRNPEDLTARQEAKLAWVASVNRRLYRAYLLKEQFRQIIAIKGRRALVMLEAYGFKEPEHLIALALLDCGGYCPPLPGRRR